MSELCPKESKTTADVICDHDDYELDQVAIVRIAPQL
jgi:hypothetical protein